MQLYLPSGLSLVQDSVQVQSVSALAFNTPKETALWSLDSSA